MIDSFAAADRAWHLSGPARLWLDRMGGEGSLECCIVRINDLAT
ncbi:hypothetical protein B1M_00555 [Burkholderia sp. TJI49]|nr:hypothetical protein B1M_00555 [Burkholderia sp. TJI49]